MYFARMASVAAKFSSRSVLAIIARTYVRTRRSLFNPSSDDLCERTQATKTNGKTMDNVAVVAKALEDQPPHLRYQPQVNSMHETQAAKIVTVTQSMGTRCGVAGRSGRMKRSTSGMARRPNGTFIQKIHRH